MKSLTTNLFTFRNHEICLFRWMVQKDPRLSSTGGRIPGQTFILSLTQRIETEKGKMKLGVVRSFQHFEDHQLWLTVVLATILGDCTVGRSLCLGTCISCLSVFWVDGGLRLVMYENEYWEIVWTLWWRTKEINKTNI